MKRPLPERYNNRVIYLAALIVTFPFVVAAAAYHGAGRLLEGLKSSERRRASDQRRQTRIRRSLRGLAGDHVQDPSKPA
jgi:hypothetical protein